MSIIRDIFIKNKRVVESAIPSAFFRFEEYRSGITSPATIPNTLIAVHSLIIVTEISSFSPCIVSLDNPFTTLHVDSTPTMLKISDESLAVNDSIHPDGICRIPQENRMNTPR